MLLTYKRIVGFTLLIFTILLTPKAQTLLDSLTEMPHAEQQFIPVTNITGDLTEMNEQIRQYRENLLTSSEKAVLSGQTDTLLLRIRIMREDPRIDQIDNLSFRNLAKMENEWSHIRVRILEREDILQDLFNRKQEILIELNSKGILWGATLDTLNARNSSATLINRVNVMTDTLNSFEKRFNSDSDFLQDMLVEISAAIILCNNTLAEIRKAGTITGTRLFRITHPPVWTAIKSVRTGERVLSTRKAIATDIYNEFRDFGREESVRIVLHLLLFLVLLRLITKSFRNIEADIENLPGNGLETVKTIIHRPWSATILVTFLLSYPIYGMLPGTVGFLNLLIIFYPVVRILYDIMPEKTRHYIILPSVAVLLAFLHSYTFGASLVSRFFLTGLDLFAVISVLSAIRKRTFRNNVPGKKAGMLLYYLAIAGTLMMGISLIASVIGAIRLAEFITYATLNSLALVFVIYAITKTLNSLLYIVIYGVFSDSLKALAVHRDLFYKRISAALTILSWTIWASFALNQFAVRSEVVAAIRAVAGAGLNVGTVNVTIAVLILFILILWFTVWVSRVIKLVIEGEIAPRVKMKRGVPGAITLLLRIAIITIGFLIAFAATGVELDKMAILLGALGVGIGFGLQNIFNNLVSGIILAFERPIQEGDVIEVEELWGTVKEIGIRSSIILTYDGAEVIVPNGNLISNELINWTLTDKQRRAEVTVGVAYGTDPERVLEILDRIAADEDEVMNEPAPLALFTGFGTSSLDFKLLVWITTVERRFIIQSRLNVSINRALAEAGIEIPFPQHDLHIRSVDKPITEEKPEK
ncbi:MAG: mechanosensitive ion channel [Bacteroidales bacterium]|nr:mechanosensitive ion channel [Bacteroidales bacterium]